MGLDSLGWTLEAYRLNDIWVESALEEELDVGTRSAGDLGSLSLEDLNEGVSNNLALLLWVLNTLELGEELLGGIDNLEVDTESLGESLLDDGTLVQAHDTVVDEDGVEAVSDGLVHELGSDGGIDTSRDGTNDLAGWANKSSDTLNLGLDEAVHGPLLLAATDVDGKVLEEVKTLWCVGDFWVELDTVEFLLLVGNTGEWGVVSLGNDQESLWKLGELVTVGHPDDEFTLGQTFKQTINVCGKASVLGDSDDRVTVLSAFTSRDILSVVPGNLLQSVADTENWDTKVENGGVDVWGSLSIDGVWASGEDDTLWLERQILDLLGARKHLGVNVEFTETTGDEMGVLRAVGKLSDIGL